VALTLTCGTNSNTWHDTGLIRGHLFKLRKLKKNCELARDIYCSLFVNYLNYVDKKD